MTDGPERMTTGRVRASDGGSPRELGDVSPDWYRGVIEQLPLTVYVDRLDETSSNVYTSPQLEAVLGYSTREWAEDEELFLKVLHPEDRERVMALQRGTRETGEPFRTEYRMIARDGRVVWFLDDATVVRDEAGRAAFHRGFLVDITKRKRLEEALRQSEDAVRREKQYVESLLEISPTAIVTLDLGGAVTSWHLAAEELVGYTRDEVIGHQLDDFIQERDDLRAEGAALYDEFVALEALRRKRYDIVLMDVEMPVIDGLEASRRIHREWTGKDRPRIIAMTANAMQGDRDTCLNAGMDDLSKPIRADQLAAALGRATPHSAVQEMRDTDVLDDSALEHLDVATGDPAFVADLVDTFLREAPALVAGLKTARQSGDAEEVRRAAHTLKSNARTFGAAGLANLCQELENTAKRQVMSEAAGLVTNIEDEYARVASALATAREERRRA